MNKYAADPKTTTLEAAKIWLRGEVAAGAKCPCCSQLAMLYKRPLTSAMTRVLIALHRRKSSGDWVHVQRFLSEAKFPPSIAASGDYAKLRYWGFIEQQEGEREDGSSRNGFWRITDKGRAFAKGETRVPGHAFVFADRVLRFDEKRLVDVRDALGKKFRYDDLMRGD